MFLQKSVWIQKKKHSVDHALITNTEKIRNALENNQ